MALKRSDPLYRQLNAEFLNGQTTCDPNLLVAEGIIKEHERLTGRKVKPWTLELAMSNEKIKKKYFKSKKSKQGNLTVTNLEFQPHYFPTLEAAKEEAGRLVDATGNSMVFLKTDKGFTFVPRVFDAMTNISRTARACGVEIVDEIITMRL